MSNPKPLTGHDIVCVASASWDAMWVNAQHLMSRLGADNKVLYLNNMGLRPPGRSKGDLAKVVRRLREWLAPATEKAPGCFVLSPISIPLHRIGFIRKLNKALLLWRVKSQMAKLNMKNPILWIFLPTGLSLVGRLGEAGVVYHCVDDYAQNPNVPSEQIRKMEDALLRQADLTIVTSPKLLEDRKDRAKRIRYFPNTADVSAFRNWKGRTPDPIAKIRKNAPNAKILGYQGNISGYKTDIRLLEKIADSFPNDRLVLVGPAGWGDPDTDIGPLIGRANVVHVGRVPFDQLPGYLHAFDVGLIPLNINDSTRGSFPMKFYEYLACGKPIVAADLPAFAAYADRPVIVRPAGDHETFIDQIKIALAADSDNAVAYLRIEEAKKNDWDRRVAQIGAEVVSVLEENKR